MVSKGIANKVAEYGCTPQYAWLQSLGPCHSKCGAGTQNVVITWDPMRNADAQAPAQTYSESP